MADDAPSKKFVPPEAMYAAIGRAISKWNKIEDSLLDVFSRIICCSIAGTAIPPNPSALFLLGDVFYSASNFRARLEVIDRLVDQTVNDAGLLAEWASLRRKIDKVYSKRSNLAHSFAWGNEHVGLPDTGPSIMASRLRSAAKRMTFNQVKQLSTSIDATNKRIRSFAVDINQHLVGQSGQGPS